MAPETRSAEGTPDATAEVLAATGAQLRARRDELAPLVGDFERLEQIERTFGDGPVPDGEVVEDDGSPPRLHQVFLREMQAFRTSLQEWSRRLEPLVHEHDKILHVLTAFESAEGLSYDAAPRRRRGASRSSQRRTSGSSAAAQARLDALRGLLAQPRPRAELAELMALSPSRVTELLDPLARAGEVVEVQDPERPSRKLWTLARSGAPEGDAGMRESTAPPDETV